jgi:phage gp36-like protein
MSISVHIEGDKSNFLSNKAVDRFKNDLRNLKQVTGVQDLYDQVDHKKYLKDGWGYQIKSGNSQEIRIQLHELDKTNTTAKKFLELKLKQLKDKRMSNVAQESILHKKHKDHKDVIDSYLSLKKISNKPILNPDDAYKNKQQYLPIVKELVQTYQGYEKYEEYYKLLLASLE